ncbi:MAG: MazG nucleotide pyrophosphohydrolase domain-containing protein [Bacteroidota bacterium]
MAAKNIPVPGPDNSDSVLDQFEAFIEIVRILRRECPWDSKQTNESIAHLMIEEAYETIEAIHSKDDDEFSKELGDLLLHIVMHAIMAEERNAFNLKDVIVKIRDKMVSRHPHVFGEVSVKNDEEVMINWEQLKKRKARNQPSKVYQKPCRLCFAQKRFSTKHLVWDSTGRIKTESGKKLRKNSPN